jgi:hypothetical protein
MLRSMVYASRLGRGGVLLLTLLGCERGLLVHPGDGGGDVEVARSTYNDTSSPVDNSASVSPLMCWGDERDALPGCASIDGCASPPIPYQECVRTADCEFTFATPLSGPQEITVNCALVLASVLDGGTSWSLSSDRRTVILAGEACDLAKTAPSVRFLATSIHSCFL